MIGSLTYFRLLWSHISTKYMVWGETITILFLDYGCQYFGLLYKQTKRNKRLVLACLSENWCYRDKGLYWPLQHTYMHLPIFICINNLIGKQSLRLEIFYIGLQGKREKNRAALNSMRVALGLICTSFSLVLLQLLPSFPIIRTERRSSCLGYPVGFLIHASQEVAPGKMIILWWTMQNREESSKPHGHGRCPTGTLDAMLRPGGEWRCLVRAVWEVSQAPFSKRPPGKVMYSSTCLGGLMD